MIIPDLSSSGHLSGNSQTWFHSAQETSPDYLRKSAWDDKSKERLFPLLAMVNIFDGSRIPHAGQK